MQFLDDIEYAGITKDQIIVALHERTGREFRAIPSQIQGIENDLSIANMDFEEFAESADESGIFRGFPTS